MRGCDGGVSFARTFHRPGLTPPWLPHTIRIAPVLGWPPLGGLPTVPLSSQLLLDPAQGSSGPTPTPPVCKPLRRLGAAHSLVLVAPRAAAPWGPSEEPAGALMCAVFQ